MDKEEIELLRPPLIEVARYTAPLREGGSLPVLAEGADGYPYVVKLRGGGHGAKSLISEFVGGMIATAAGMRVPQLVFMNLDEAFGITEPDEEVQELLAASRGLNMGMSFLSGALTWDVTVNTPSHEEASRIVWLDAFLTNVDRTATNTNMLLWRGALWLIDHGSSLYFHHNWEGWENAALSPFPYIKNHALLPHASRLLEADDLMRRTITPRLIKEIVEMIPEDWLRQSEPGIEPDEQRRVYTTFLTTRLENSKIFTDHAIQARKQL